MTFWSLTNSDFSTNCDFPPISWPWYRAWPLPIMSGFHGAFAAGVACQQGTLILPDTWFVPHCGLACAPIVETRFHELAMSLLKFSPRITLGTFSRCFITPASPVFPTAVVSSNSCCKLTLYHLSRLLTIGLKPVLKFLGLGGISWNFPSHKF